MSIQTHSQQDCLLVTKPQGLTTHAVEKDRWGFVEYLSLQEQRELCVVQRLDKETSGAMLFAFNSEVAQKLTESFSQKQNHKVYYFITDRTAKSDDFTAQSFIEKNKNSFVSVSTQEPNSETHFKKVKTYKKWSLWQAIPMTGKPHQIRLHAEDHGLSILGDSEHGGTPFLRLCLHAFQLKINAGEIQISHQAPLPLFFENLELLENPFLMEFIVAIEKRNSLFHYQQDDSLRLAHTDVRDIRIDRFGEILWVYWYREQNPTDLQLQDLQKLLKLTQTKSILIRQMLNRGQSPNDAETWIVGDPIPPRWIAQENSARYILKTNQGLSPGLFLDQRENRWWIQNHSAQKKVLNLFSYTSGFSLNAAIGGAQQVTTVDLSKNFIEWSKENFELNQINVSQHEFWVADSFIFLAGSKKRNKTYDLIICDPPSFSRSKEKVFKIEKDIDELIDLCLSVLNPGGQLLFSCNYEKWTFLEFQQRVQKIIQKKSCRLRALPPAGLDYEFPGQEPLMKALLIERIK